MRCHDIWQTGTNVLKEYAASIKPDNGGNSSSKNMVYIKVHNTTSQKTVIFTATVVRTFGTHTVTLYQDTLQTQACSLKMETDGVCDLNSH
jgi:hypothetical protein